MNLYDLANLEGGLGNAQGGGGLGFMDTIGQNRQGIIGLGLGLMGGTRADPFGPALQGYQTGASQDAARIRYAQQLRHQAAQEAFQRQQAAQHQQNWQEQFGEQKRQFEEARKPKPSVQWKETPEGENIPYLIDPTGPVPVRKINPNLALQMGFPPPDSDTNTEAAPAAPPGAVQFTPSESIPTQADPAAIPYTASPVQGALSGSTTVTNLPLNKKEAIKKYSHDVGEQAATTKTRQQAGERVLGLMDRLDEKLDDPSASEAVGPMHGYASQQPMWNPARVGYEYLPKGLGGVSNEAHSLMGQIQSDAQAINTEMQQAYLKGQGSVTENERAQISKILGEVGGARNPKEAKALVENAREIVRITNQYGPGAWEAMQNQRAMTPKDGGAESLPRPSSPTEALKLPRGTKFLDENGTVRVRP